MKFILAYIAGIGGAAYMAINGPAYDAAGAPDAASTFASWAILAGIIAASVKACQYFSSKAA